MKPLEVNTEGRAQVVQAALAAAVVLTETAKKAAMVAQMVLTVRREPILVETAATPVLAAVAKVLQHGRLARLAANCSPVAAVVAPRARPGILDRHRVETVAAAMATKVLLAPGIAVQRTRVAVAVEAQPTLRQARAVLAS